MVPPDLFDTLRALDRGEKLHIMQFLVAELVQEETNLLQPGKAYPVWSPYDAFDAAGSMLAVLEAAQADDDAAR